MDGEQLLARDLGRLQQRGAEPAVTGHLVLQRADPLGPLRMARDVVRERALVTQPEWGHAGTVRRSVNAERSDLVVVGAGAAGLFACLTAARAGARVTLVSARPLAETASYWAQGGLAAALAAGDSPERHLQDTLDAGRGIVRRSAAEVLADEAPDRFRDLEALGVRFDADRHGNVALGLEGGHSVRRVVHAGGSATGRRILRQLSADVAEEPAIAVLEGARAASLVGRRALHGRPARGRPHADRPRHDPRHRRRRRAVVAHHQPARLVRLRPAARTRRGRRAGRPRVRPVPPDRGDRHPRPRGLPDHRGDPRRGRDAARRPRRALRRRAGAARRRRPRDLPHAARAGDRRRSASTCATSTRTRFPNVVAALREAGLDPATEMVPVAPASHYVMGGIVTDLDGRSRVPVCTRSASAPAPGCTAPTGSPPTRSRSASCSAAARRCGRSTSPSPAPASPGRRPGGPMAPAPTRETRKAMWRHAGLERDAEGLRPLLDDPHPLARLVARCALFREESRGAHSRADFPERRSGARRAPHAARGRRSSARSLALVSFAGAGQTERRFAS